MRTRTHARTRTKRLYILIACEESQAECKAFRELGHIAFSCDVQSCIRTGNKNWHIKGDVTPFLEGKTSFVTESGIAISVPRWDLIMAHPPCTYLCKISSVQLFRHSNESPGENWFYNNRRNIWVNGERLKNVLKARNFFVKCLHAKAPFLAVENPIPMAFVQLPKPSCYACPSWYGVKYTKKTLYWLKNLPPLLPGITNPDAKCYVQASRGKYRSRTFPQLARALAKQWSEYIMTQLQSNQPGITESSSIGSSWDEANRQSEGQQWER